MAEKCVESLQPEIGRELCLVKGKNGEFLGYKKDILIENLSERENTMFVCIRCQGIMREVCTSSDGEQFCSCCKKKRERTHPNLHVSNMVLSFKCSCPLSARGCGWLGALGGCQVHLDTCGYVYETCKLRCGVVLQRSELKVHEKDCLHRIVECKHCRKNLKFCELPTHLEMCPKMEMSCELKCGEWLCRENMAQHLKKECGLVVEMCKLRCGVELTRNELKIHVTDTCVQRKIPCEHCGEDFKYCDMTNHLDVCPRMKVSCELECGVIMCREDMTQHLEVDCPEKELECPFAKYKCEMGLIKRKNMSKHLEEKRIEHLELKVNWNYTEFTLTKKAVMEESEVIAKQKEKISEQSVIVKTMSQEILSLKGEVQYLTHVIIAKQSAMIETMSQEIISLNTKMQVVQVLNHIPIELEWQITKLPDSGGGIKKRFIVAGYHLEFEFCRNFYGRLQILMCPLTGCFYEKLKWPFTAQFITRLKCQHNPMCNSEFKSHVIVVEKEQFNSVTNIHLMYLARISKYEFMRNYFIDGVADIEIYVSII